MATAAAEVVAVAEVRVKEIGAVATAVVLVGMMVESTGMVAGNLGVCGLIV